VRNWRVITAIAAVVLAAVAGVLVWQYVDEADDRAADKYDPVEVVVADGDIAAGTTGASAIDNDRFKVARFNRESVKPDWVRPGDDAALRALRDLIAVADIPDGQPIVAGFFAQRGETGSFSGFVAEGMQAITINVDDARGVAGFVKPGDIVSVLASVGRDSLYVESAPGGALRLNPATTAFVLPAAKVLAVGQTTELGTSRAVTRSRDTNGDGRVDEQDEPDEQQQTVSRGLITLEVTPRQAEQLVQATTFASTVYLSLNPAGFDPATFASPEEVVEAVNWFDVGLTRVQDVLRRLPQD